MRNTSARLVRASLPVVLPTLVLALNSAANAAVTWAVPGSTGSWTVAANWSPAAVPTATDDVIIDGQSTSNSTVNYVYSGSFSTGFNSLTVSSGDTLTLAGQGHRLGFTNGITNAGTIKAVTNQTIVAQSTGGTGTLALTNTGRITAEGSGASLLFNGATITNTGGTLSAQTGGKLDLSGGPTITGGTVSVDATSTLTNTNVNTTSTLNAVAITNNGSLYLNQSGTTGSRNMGFTLSGGSFTNGTTATISLLQEGSKTLTSNVTHRNDFTITGTNAFTNAGTINIQNTTADVTSGDQYAQMTFNGSGGGSFSNTGSITVQDSATGTVTGSATQYSKLNVTSASLFSNTGTITVRQAAPSDTIHYAQVAFGADWTNGGSMIADGGSINSGAFTYGQSGATSVTRLLNSGRLLAGAANISGGTLEGNGTIIAATTIAGGAHFAPGYQGAGILSIGTSTTAAPLTLNNTSQLDFDLDTPNVAAGTGGNDLAVVQGALTLDGQLNITPGASFGLGTYTLLTYTGALTNNQLTVATVPAGYNYSINTSTPGVIELTVSSIPEPTGLGLLTLAGGLVLSRRRRA